MPFGGFPFTRLFRLTGTPTPVTAVYIDLRVRGTVVYQKVLSFDNALAGWVLNLSGTETLELDQQRVTGHLVCVIAGIHAPQALVTIDVHRSLTTPRA